MKTTQITLEDNIYNQILNEAKKRNKTVAEYIQELVYNNIPNKPPFEKMLGIWKNKNINLEDIRKKAWK